MKHFYQRKNDQIHVTHKQFFDADEIIHKEFKKILYWFGNFYFIHSTKTFLFDKSNTN